MHALSFLIFLMQLYGIQRFEILVSVCTNDIQCVEVRYNLIRLPSQVASFYWQGIIKHMLTQSESDFLGIKLLGIVRKFGVW